MSGPRCEVCGGRRGYGSHERCGTTPVPAAAPGCAAPDIPGYQGIARLGDGGFGTVIRARRAGREVAIKLAHGDAESRARLAREVAILRRLASPGGPGHAPAVLDTGALADGTPFAALELIAAPTLAAAIAAPRGLLAGTDLARPLIAIAEALRWLHDRGVVHRDLKPENVLVDGARAVLVDFGLADDGHSPRVTATGDAAGTATYMAPEQIAGAAAIAATDVYALGVIAFELATGRPPFVGTDAEVRVAHQAHRPPAPAELATMPPALDAVIRDCLAKDPARRPRTRELAVRFAAALSEPTAPPRSPASAMPVFAGPAESAVAIAEPTVPPRSPASAMRTEIACAVLAFDGPAKNAARIAAAVAARAGELACAEREVWAAVFSPLDGARPVERARLAGDDLVAAGLVARAVVVVRPLAIRTRSDGVRRVITAVLPPVCELDRVAPGRVVVSDGASLEGVDRAECGDRCTGDDRAPAAAPPEPAFVGRTALLDELVGQVRDAIAARRSRRITVVGASGMGRSRLGRQLVARLAAPGDSMARPLQIAWLDLGALAGAGRVAGGPRWIAHELLALPRDPPDDPLAAVRAVVAGDGSDDDGCAALAHALGWAAPATPLARLRAAPGAYRDALARALAAALAGAAAREPLVIIVDDAHLADAATRGAIRIASEAQPAALAICLLSERPLWDGEPGVALPPLGDGEAAALCRDALRPASDVPASAIAQLVAHSGGAPRAVLELARALHAIGAIRPRARGGEWYLEAGAVAALSLGPPAVERAVPALDPALDPALGAHAGALALLAPGFTACDAARIVERIDRAALPLDPGVALARLIARGVVGGGDRLQIASPALRDALAAALPAELARRVHAAAIAHHAELAAAHPDEPGHRARLAPHVAAAGDPGAAAAILIELADRARDRHDDLAAEQLYSRAIELGGAGPGSPAAERHARQARAAVRYRLGRYEDALADYARARALAAAPAVLAELWLDEATALDWMGEYARSSACLEAARAAIEVAPSPRLAVRRRVAEGRSLWRRAGPCAPAIAALERALADAAALPGALCDALYDDRTAAMVMLVYLLPSQGRHDDAEAIAEAAIALCEQRGDRHHLMAVLTNRQVVSLARGLPDRAIADLERAGRIGHELGMPIQRYRTALGLAEIHGRLGRTADARRHAERARAIEAESSAAGVQQTAAVMLVQFLIALGELGAARDLAAAVDRAALLDEDRLLLRGMELALAGGDDDAAWAALLDDTARAVPAYLPDLLEHRALAAQRDGRPADARRHLAAAVAAAEAHDPIALARLHRAQRALEAA